MKNKNPLQTSREHFLLRSRNYNSSSNWVVDNVLVEKIVKKAQPSADKDMLDIAVGTGIIAAAFHEKVRSITGIDITVEMTAETKRYLDNIVLAEAEDMPFPDGCFDICTCRQGLQFMELDEVIPQIFRVMKPGGRVVLCHLSSHGNSDMETAFKIQRLRNPARKNFFVPEDFKVLLEKSGFSAIDLEEYISVESVNKWIDNDAIEPTSKDEIRKTYIDSNEEFKKIHNIEFTGGDILDSMKFCIASAVKPES